MRKIIFLNDNNDDLKESCLNKKEDSETKSNNYGTFRPNRNKDRKKDLINLIKESYANKEDSETKSNNYGTFRGNKKVMIDRKNPYISAYKPKDLGYLAVVERGGDHRIKEKN